MKTDAICFFYLLMTFLFSLSVSMHMGSNDGVFEVYRFNSCILCQTKYHDAHDFIISTGFLPHHTRVIPLIFHNESTSLHIAMCQ